MNKIISQLKQTYNTIAETFSHTRHKLWPEMYRLAEIVKAGKVLDLGCGNGRLYEVFKDNPKIHYLGIDFSSKMIAIARKRYPRAKFLEGDITQLTLPPNHYDAVFIIAAYHHIPYKKLRLKTLKDIKKALKEEGILVLSVWNLWHKKTIKRVLQSWLRKITFRERGGIFDIYYPFNDQGKIYYRYYRMFTPRGIKKEIKRAGFKIVKEERWKEGQNLVFYLKK